MSLYSYFNKNVKIIDCNDKIWKGYVETYTPAIDTDDELYDEIGLICNNKLIGLDENEIKSIEVIGDE